MIAHTIEAASESRVFERIIVSTDDEEIAAVSEKYGADVPFRRPDALADDYTPISEVTADALDRLDPDGGKYDCVAQLMANCPLRTESDISDSFRHFVENEGDVQLSVFEFGWQNPWWAMRMGDEGGLSPLFGEMLQEEVRSQDQETLYCITGAIWWGRTNVIRERRTFHIEERTGWPMKWQNAVDIDTEEDWQFAEVLAEQKKAV